MANPMVVARSIDVEAQREGLGLALSGGGFRAALFSLGAFHYLNDVRDLHDVGQEMPVRAISSVSGGSLTNAMLARFDINTADRGEFREHLHALAVVSTRLRSPPLDNAVTATLLRSGRRLWDETLEALGLTDGQTLRQLDEITDPAVDINHVFCATNLHDGKFLYLSTDFIYGRNVGWHAEGGLEMVDLETAVRASSAIPIIFPAVLLPPGVFEDGEKPHFPKRGIRLVDGGIYDNLGEQWFATLEQHLRPERQARTESPQQRSLNLPELVVIVNAGTTLEWNRFLPWSTVPIWRAEVPVARWVSGVWRAGKIVYENSTERRLARRRREFRTAFDEWLNGRDAPPGTRGTLLSIGRSPFAVPDELRERRGGEERLPLAQERAEQVLADLLSVPCDWRRLVDRNRRVPSRPVRLSKDQAACLMYHGYMLAYSHLHTLYGFPRPPGLKRLDEYRDFWFA